MKKVGKSFYFLKNEGSVKYLNLSVSFVFHRRGVNTARAHSIGGNPYDYTVEVRNRFKGLDLIDRVPEELWTEVRDIVQETGIKTIPMEKKCKKAK